MNNAELNGKLGVVVPRGTSETPEADAALKVRLETGLEVAVKSVNLEHLVGSAALSAAQVEKLQEVAVQLQAAEEAAKLAQASAPVSL